MEEPMQTDHVLTGVIAALIIMVFVLDLLTPLGIAIWALYVIPLGLTTWSSIRNLLPSTAGVCSVLIILGYFYSPPGVSFEYAVIDRSLGIVMVWAVVFFLWPKRDERES